MFFNRAIYFAIEIKKLLVSIKIFRMLYTMDTDKNQKNVNGKCYRDLEW